MRQPCTAFTSMRAARRTSSRCVSRTSDGRRVVPRRPPKQVEARDIATRGPRPAGVWRMVGERTRAVLAAGLRSLSPPLAAGYYEELEGVLIRAELGPAVSSRLAAAVREKAPRTREEAEDSLVSAATSVMSHRPRELEIPITPACLLFYGVNGTGKTTTVGKLAHRLQQEGRRPLVVAADTYR